MPGISPYVAMVTPLPHRRHSTQPLMCRKRVIGMKNDRMDGMYQAAPRNGTATRSPVTPRNHKAEC